MQPLPEPVAVDNGAGSLPHMLMSVTHSHFYATYSLFSPWRAQSHRHTAQGSQEYSSQ